VDLSRSQLCVAGLLLWLSGRFSLFVANLRLIREQQLSAAFRNFMQVRHIDNAR
jgi:hypothetical protein